MVGKSIMTGGTNIKVKILYPHPFFGLRVAECNNNPHFIARHFNKTVR